MKKHSLKQGWNNFWRHNENYDVQNKELVHFATGVAGQNLSYCMVSSYLEYFCTNVLFIRPLYTGILLYVMRAWDAFNDALVGGIVDRFHFKNGEKLRPYIKVVCVPLSVLTALMFVNFGFRTEAAAICYVAAIYFLWDTLYSFHDIAQWGMVARISNQSKRRGDTAYAGRVGGMIGSAVTGLIPIVYGFSIDGILPLTLTQCFIIFGVVYGSGMILSMVQLRCKERAPVKENQGSFWDSFRLIKQNKIVMWLVLANILGSCTFVVQATYFYQYMISFNVGGQTLSGTSLITIIGIITGVPGTIALLLTPKLAKKMGGMQMVLLISTLTNIFGRILMFFVGYQGYRILFMILIMTIMNIPSNMTGIASTTLWGDSIDYIEWKTGKRNEGTVFALQNFIAKLTSGMGLLFSGITLTILNFDPEAIANGTATLSQEFQNYSWLIFTLGPALGSVFYLIPLLMLKYSDEERRKVTLQLARRRAAACGVLGEVVTLDGGVEVSLEIGFDEITNKVVKNGEEVALDKLMEEQILAEEAERAATIASKKNVNSAQSVGEDLDEIVKIKKEGDETDDE